MSAIKNIKEALVVLAKCIDRLEYGHTSKARERMVLRTREMLIEEILNKK